MHSVGCMPFHVLGGVAALANDQAVGRGCLEEALFDESPFFDIFAWHFKTFVSAPSFPPQTTQVCREWLIERDYACAEVWRRLGLVVLEVRVERQAWRPRGFVVVCADNFVSNVGCRPYVSDLP